MEVQYVLLVPSERQSHARLMVVQHVNNEPYEIHITVADEAIALAKL